jgi:acyl-CoA thioesterase-1
MDDRAKPGAQSTDTVVQAAPEPVDSAHPKPVTGERVPDPPGSGPRVVFFGTSLTAGYGIQPNQAFPAIVQRKASSDGLPIRAINAGLSGETSAGAVRRIDWDVRTPFDIIVLETGANDALRGLDPAQLRDNLRTIIGKIRKAQPHATIVMLEMQAPPNMGAAYGKSFREAYSEVARKEKVKLLPFFLDGVAGRPELNQADGLHPTAAGARLIADNVWRGLRPVVREAHKRGKYAPKN